MLAQSLDYTAFGEETTRIKEPFNPWRYSAKRFDRELGLSYFGHRFYDASLGRWMTADPLGFVDGLNLYTYVFNDPLSYGDADGRFAIPLLGLSWGASGCAATAIFSNPVGWVLGCAVITAVAIGWTTQQLIESRHIPLSTGNIINSALGFTQAVLNSRDISVNSPPIHWKNAEVYVPDRPLPSDKHGTPIPETDAPHT